MRPSLRFLVGVVLAWAGVRAATLGILPGASIFRVPAGEAHSAPAPPPVAATQFPSIEPIAPASPADASLMQPASMPFAAYPVWPAGYRPVLVPIGSALASAPRMAPAERHYTSLLLPEPRAQFYPSQPVLDEWPLVNLASAGRQAARSETVTPLQSPVPAIHQARLDRVQLSMWALLRSTQALSAAPSPSLAPNGMLGGSQAGARLIYNLNELVGAMLRTSTEVGRRGGEVALGVRVHPLQSVPVWITAERRQALGKYGGGRSAFALFAEGGVYDRPLGGKFVLNGYAEGGVVGLRRRDIFADAALTVTRPVYKKFSAGIGVWGGVQPGVYRVDVGPRVTMQVRKNVRVHFDYRQRVAGNARPGSGPAVTLAGDF
ncbi:MAG TPA: hypothetical protein VN106_03200 [Sphingomicrobium sp.]|nr:hypothetical protein [Sphingomicrobium sp.]